MDRFLSRSLLAIAGAGLACLAAEGFARRSWPQFGLDHAMARFTMGDVEGSPERFKPSGVLGWERRARDDNDGLRLKEDGFRSSHIRFSDKPYRILFVGDSLADALAGHFGGGDEERLGRAVGRPVEVWDFSCGGYSIEHYLRILEFKCRDFKFDVLVLIFCLNDVYSDVPVIIQRGGRLFMTRENAMARELVFHPGLFRWSHLYRTLFLQENWRRLRTQEKGGEASEEEAFHRTFDSIVEWTRTRGVGFFCVVFPYFKPPETYGEDERESGAAFRRAFQRQGTTSLWLEDCFPADYWSRYRNEVEPSDFIHPDEEGYEKAKECIVGFLENRLRP